MSRFLKVTVAGFALLAMPASGDKPPDTWDGLLKIQSKFFDVAYVAPGADFRAYNKVMVDPAEAAFRKNWQKKYNNSTIGVSNRITDKEAQEALTAIQDGFTDVFSDAYAEAGFQVVTEPGPDVLRLRTAVFNIDVQAPEQMTGSRSYSYSAETGTAALMLEARDSMSGAILARAVDHREIGDTGFMMRRTKMSNRVDFEREFRFWAKISVDAFKNVRTITPIDADGNPQTAPS
jgi:hypothetical protein